MVDLPLFGIGNQVNGIQDGPDSTADGLGLKGKNAPTSDVTPVAPPPADPKP
jgi:hypothetical protein